MVFLLVSGLMEVPLETENLAVLCAVLRKEVR